VTLLELLIVLVIMAVSAAMVAPVLSRREIDGRAADASWINAARHTAIRRGEPLRLERHADGAWRLTTQRTGTAIDSGRVDTARATMVLLIDALGGCVPATAMPLAFDALSCDMPRDSAGRAPMPSTAASGSVGASGGLGR